MPYIVKIGDKEFKIDLEMEGNEFKISLNGKPMRVEVIEGNNPSHLTLIVENKPYDIIIEEVQPQNENTIYVNGELFWVEVKDERVQKFAELKRKVKHTEEVSITVPMPGLVIEVEVKEGDKVKTGQGLVVIEAMKMQNEIKAPKDGVVKKITIKKGMTVNSGDTLVIIE